MLYSDERTDGRKKENTSLNGVSVNFFYCLIQFFTKFMLSGLMCQHNVTLVKFCEQDHHNLLIGWILYSLDSLDCSNFPGSL